MARTGKSGILAGVVLGVTALFLGVAFWRAAAASDASPEKLIRVRACPASG